MLPADTARCPGSPDMVLLRSVCSDCRRREPSASQWQTSIKPEAIRRYEGVIVSCPNKIERG